MVVRKSYLAFCAGPEREVPRRELPAPIRPAFATFGLVSDFFGQDGSRLGTFLRFMEQGYIGLILHDGHEWASYGWMSTPDSAPPVQLPSGIRKLGANWIIYCHTRKEYRGRGLYKALLASLVERAREKGRQPVYIHTEKSNLASRRGILGAGFGEAGIIKCYFLRMPRISVFLKAGWDRSRPHPPLPGRQEPVFKKE